MTTMLTLAKAAEILNVNPNTLRRFADNGQLKVYRMGNTRGDRRFDENDVRKFANAYAYKE